MHWLQQLQRFGRKSYQGEFTLFCQKTLDDWGVVEGEAFVRVVFVLVLGWLAQRTTEWTWESSEVVARGSVWLIV